jgi:hypothetical protein
MTMQTATPDAVQSFDIHDEIEIAASIEVTFESVLEQLGPGGEMPDGKPFPFTLEPWPGGRWFRDLGNNTGHLWGHVQVIKPPTILEIIGPMPMSYPAINHLQYRLKAEGNRTRLALHHRAMGLITPDHREGMPKGFEFWLQAIRKRAERK